MPQLIFYLICLIYIIVSKSSSYSFNFLFICVLDIIISKNTHELIHDISI